MRTKSSDDGCRAPADAQEPRPPRTARRRRHSQDAPKTAASASSRTFPLVNQLDFGVRGTSFGVDSDPARFQRYRDVRDGGTVDRFRLFKDTDAYRYNLQADHVGYRDQRFSGTYTNYGKVKAIVRMEPDSAVLQQ